MGSRIRDRVAFCQSSCIAPVAFGRSHFWIRTRLYPFHLRSSLRLPPISKTDCPTGCKNLHNFLSEPDTRSFAASEAMSFYPEHFGGLSGLMTTNHAPNQKASFRLEMSRQASLFHFLGIRQCDGLVGSSILPSAGISGGSSGTVAGNSCWFRGSRPWSVTWTQPYDCSCAGLD